MSSYERGEGVGGSFLIFRLENVQSGAYLRRKFRRDDMHYMVSVYGIENKPWFNFMGGGGGKRPKPLPVRQCLPRLYLRSCRGRAVKTSDFHTGGPRLEPRPGSSALGQGALSPLYSLSRRRL